MKLRIKNPWLAAIHGLEVEVAVNKHGRPIEKYWRNRLRDAKRDDCVEVIEPKGKGKKGR